MYVFGNLWVCVGLYLIVNVFVFDGECVWVCLWVCENDCDISFCGCEFVIFVLYDCVLFAIVCEGVCLWVFEWCVDEFVWEGEMGCRMGCVLVWVWKSEDDVCVRVWVWEIIWLFVFLCLILCVRLNVKLGGRVWGCSYFLGIRVFVRGCVCEV